MNGNTRHGVPNTSGNGRPYNNGQPSTPTPNQAQNKLPPKIGNSFTSANTYNSSSSRAFNAIPYTPEEQERISMMLNKVLGPEYVSFRPGGGGQKVSYIEGWRALNLANEVFGFNGWSSELISSQVDFFDTHGGSGRFSMGLSVVVRITIKDGTFHEDFGYGYIENAKSKAMAFEKCKKEAFTDGLKRCLRCFGNVLGNCLYDRTIIPKLNKVKVQGAELESRHFHRDPMVNERMAKDEKSTISRETVIPNNNNDKNNNNDNNNNNNNDNDKNMPVSNSNERPQHIEPQNGKNDIVKDFDDSFVFSDDLIDDQANDGLDDYEMEMLLHKNLEKNTEDGITSEQSNNNNNNSMSTDNSEKEEIIPESVSFVSAKAADIIQKNPVSCTDSSKVARFDPKFVSPNIRRTVDPNKSTPIKKNSVKSSTAIKTTVTIASQLAPTIANGSTSTPLGKRLLGLPPSQRSKRTQLSQSVDKENHPGLE